MSIELGMIEAPWSDDQVTNINQYQTAGAFHPFTCDDENCRAELVAHNDGLRCPACDYRQTWVYKEMADGSAMSAYKGMMEGFR